MAIVDDGIQTVVAWRREHFVVTGEDMLLRNDWERAQSALRHPERCPIRGMHRNMKGRYCHVCGGSANYQAPKTRCSPRHFTMLVQGLKFCPDCGDSLNESDNRQMLRVRARANR
jgi:hypothetical protein